LERKSIRDLTTFLTSLNTTPPQFEELVEQFIPSDPTWKGWVKMALHQPFFEVIPVARELLSKTKRIASKSVQQSTNGTTSRRQKPTKMSERPLPKLKGGEGTNILASPFTEEPEVMTTAERPKSPPQITRVNGAGHPSRGNSFDRDKARVTSMFRRSTTSHARSMSSGDHVSLRIRVSPSGNSRRCAGHCVVDLVGTHHRRQH
jgi:hypothetical protein